MDRSLEGFDPVRLVRIAQGLVLSGALLLWTGLAAATPDNSSFIDNVYSDLLNRGADQVGRASWTSALDSGTLGRGDLALSMMRSPEYDLNIVQSLYTRLLGRSMDSLGMGFVGVLQQGSSRERVMASMLGSGEYYANRGGSTNLGFLKALYQDVLHRDIDALGQSHFGALLASGVSRTEVAMMMLQSREARVTLVGNLYQELLWRNVDAAGRDAWVSLLEHGGSIEDIVAGIVGSDEYFYLDRSNHTVGGVPLDPFPGSLLGAGLFHDGGGVTSTLSALGGGPPLPWTPSTLSGPPGGNWPWGNTPNGWTPSYGDAPYGSHPPLTSVLQRHTLALTGSALALLVVLNARRRWQVRRSTAALSRPGTC